MAYEDFENYRKAVLRCRIILTAAAVGELLRPRLDAIRMSELERIMLYLGEQEYDPPAYFRADLIDIEVGAMPGRTAYFFEYHAQVLPVPGRGYPSPGIYDFLVSLDDSSDTSD